MKWKTVSFEDGVNSRGSGAVGLARSQWEEGGQYPVIGQGAEFIEGWTNRADLLLAPRPAVVLYGGHTRRAKFVDIPFVPGPNVKILEPKETLDVKFLFYFLSQLPIESRGYADHFPEVRRSSIPLPPLAEQRRIAEVLDQAEALRTKRRAALAQLNSLTQSLFLDLFGDPVANPKKWPRVEFSELLSNIDSGWSPVCLDRPVSDNEWGVLKLGAITQCEFDASENKALPPGVEPDPSIEVKSGDLLFTRKNTHELVAACALVRETPPRLMMSDLVFRFRLRPDAKLDTTFLHQLLISPTKRREIQKLAGGSSGSMPNISKARLEMTVIEVPPIPLQREFARRVTAVEKLKAAQRASLAELDALFATLQHRAFRGEL